METNEAARRSAPRKKGTLSLPLFSQDRLLPPWAWWQLTVARRPETSFLQLVQQNNCIVFSCQKLTGWNQIVEQGTAVDTQGWDYGSESRHNCVRGKTADVEGGGGGVGGGLTASVTCP